LIGHGKLLMPVQTQTNETCNIVDEYFVWSIRVFFLLRRAISHIMTPGCVPHIAAVAGRVADGLIRTFLRIMVSIHVNYCGWCCISS
jgi:hypothetical protein